MQESANRPARLIELLLGAVLMTLALLAGAPAPAEDGIFVSPKGVNSATGSRAAPLQTIAAARARAKPGTTITLLEGTR
jgi:hypothetical protein